MVTRPADPRRGVGGVQEFRSSGVQEFRSSGVQEFRSSGVQEFRVGWTVELREKTPSATGTSESVQTFLQPAPELL
jgi:hypothetical protein